MPEMLPAPVFAEAMMGEDAAAVDTVEHPAIIIDMPRGKQLSIYPAASPVMVAAALKALR